MLIYLDNASSIGPGLRCRHQSPARGINTRTSAAKFWKLHTLGVRSGYNQDDVVSCGQGNHGLDNLRHRRQSGPWWRVPIPPTPARARPRDAMLGKAYRDTGVEQGRAVLADLALQSGNSQTCGHQAGAAFHRRRAVARADRDADEDVPRDRRRPLAGVEGTRWRRRRSRSPDQAKMKHPSERMVASIRAAGSSSNGDVRRMVPALNRLGEPPWRPPAPKGFGDENADWLDPGLAHRLDHRQCDCSELWRTARSAGHARDLARPDCVDRDAQRQDEGRNQAAGADAAAYGPRNSNGGDHAREASCRDTPRVAARVRRAVRLGVRAEDRTRGGS